MWSRHGLPNVITVLLLFAGPRAALPVCCFGCAFSLALLAPGEAVQVDCSVAGPAGSRAALLHGRAPPAGCFASVRPAGGFEFGTAAAGRVQCRAQWGARTRAWAGRAWSCARWRAPRGRWRPVLAMGPLPCSRRQLTADAS